MMVNGLLPRREWLRPDEVAEFLSCSARHIRRLAENGRLVAFRLSDGPTAPLRIQRTSVIGYVEEMRRLFEAENGIIDSLDSSD